MNKENDKVLIEIGITMGFFTKNDADKAIAAQKIDQAIGSVKPVLNYLYEENKVTKEQIAEILSEVDQASEAIQNSRILAGRLIELRGQCFLLVTKNKIIIKEYWPKKSYLLFGFFLTPLWFYYVSNGKKEARSFEGCEYQGRMVSASDETYQLEEIKSIETFGPMGMRIKLANKNIEFPFVELGVRDDFKSKLEALLANDRSIETFGVPSESKINNKPDTVPDELPKNRNNYRLLAILLGFFGCHNFYAGRSKIAWIQLCLSILTGFALSPFVWIWAVVELFTVDSDGNGVSMS